MGVAGNVRNMAKVLYAAVAVAALLVACSSDDEGGRPAPPVETVRFYISVPEAQGTRVGDPGQPTGEGVDWNTLALMLEYTGADAPADPRILKTFTKAEFDAMPRMVGDTAVRILSLDVPEGSAYIYGVTYSSEAKEGADAIKSALEQWDNNGGVSDLTIPNSYASGDANRVAKFLSVATGYYRDETTDKRAAYDISGSAEGEVGQLPRVRLVRLAAKIDIQWDAQAAYDNTSHSYTQVDVTGFTFNGGAKNPQPDNTGSGRLFPDLVSDDATSLGGSTTFYNDTEISKRNGRVYHYVFPDGASKPTIKFKLAEGEDNVGTDYTFSFADKLRQATWYKVNTTIKGLDGSNKIELTPDNTLGN